jgi:Lrp/AsnC family transcriptional regulator, leucine-responsive regulatory protein
MTMHDRRESAAMPPRRPPQSGSNVRNDGELLDAVNRQVLAILADDARINTAELARRVGMSAPAVRERINRLEEAGVIRGYHVDIDPAKVGLPVAAWVRVRPGPGLLPKVADLARRTPQVSECHRITGDDCFLLKVHGPSIEDLESVLDSFLLFGQTTTAVVVTTPVAPRPPMPL